MEVKTPEKRRFPRFKFKTPIRFQVRGLPKFVNSLTEDIGLGGLSLTTNEFLAPLTNVMLEFDIWSHFLTPVGRVAWVSPLGHSNRYRLGIEFIELEPEQKNRLKDFLDLQQLNY